MLLTELSNSLSKFLILLGPLFSILGREDVVFGIVNDLGLILCSKASESELRC